MIIECCVLLEEGACYFIVQVCMRTCICTMCLCSCAITCMLKWEENFAHRYSPFTCFVTAESFLGQHCLHQAKWPKGFLAFFCRLLYHCRSCGISEMHYCFQSCMVSKNQTLVFTFVQQILSHRTIYFPSRAFWILWTSSFWHTAIWLLCTVT